MIIDKGNNPNSFTLPDQNGNEITISDYSSQYKLLSFHPLAWTSVCAKQMKSLESNYEKFSTLNTVPFGISIDPVPSKKAWSESLNLKKLKILSDFYPLGFVSKMMGVFIDSKGISGRANILFGPKGNVLWSKQYELSELPDIDQVFKIIKEVQSLK